MCTDGAIRRDYSPAKKLKARERKAAWLHSGLLRIIIQLTASTLPDFTRFNHAGHGLNQSLKIGCPVIPASVNPVTIFSVLSLSKEEGNLQENRNGGVSPDVDWLVGRAVEGDAEAFGKLYDMYVDRVYRHVYYRVGNVTDAEDLTQQVFLKAWQAVPRYRKTAPLFWPG